MTHTAQYYEIAIATAIAKSRAKNKILKMVMIEPFRKKEFLELQNRVFRILDQTCAQMLENIYRDYEKELKEISITVEEINL